MVKISLLSRIFVWSVLFELLMFFTIPLLGQRPNISRLLQVIVLIGLLMKWCSSRSYDLTIVNINRPIYRYYSFYFSLAVFAGIVGVLSGAYSLSFVDNLNEVTESHSARTSISPIENAALEYIITLYYFVYFAILPQYLLKSEKSVNYFLSRFKFTFIACLVVGFVDFGFSATGYPILPSDIVQGGNVGDRFHGLAGEPRDAFVYLFLGLAILYLQAYFMGYVLSKWWLLPIIAAAIFTKSASGLIGILLFLALYGFYILSKCSILKIFKLITLSFVVISFLYIAVSTSERTMLYVEDVPAVWSTLESGMELTYPLSVQGYNIYPFHDLTVKFRDLNLLPILIGSGFGSASVLNNKYVGDFYIVSNPHSQLVRLIYETGLIGTLLFIFSFFYPVKYLTKHLSSKQKELFIFLIFLLIGLFFGHRGAALYVFLGIFIAVFRVNDIGNSK